MGAGRRATRVPDGMCLAVPAKIVSLDGARAVVERDGLCLTAVVAFLDRPRVGDYVLLHAGFAIRKWSAADLREYRALLRQARRPSARR